MSDESADRSFVSDAAVAVGARHLTLAFVVFAVGQFVAARVADAASVLGLGTLAYALLVVPTAYLAAKQFLRGVAVVVADAA